MLKQAIAEIKDVVNELETHKVALDQAAIVAITDSEGKIIYVNDKFCEVSKYTREEVIGLDHRIINSGHHPKAYIKEFWDTIKAGKIWRGEFKNKSKDGSAHWFDSTVVPFKDQYGSVYKYLAIRYEITERKQADELFQDLVSGIAAKVGEDFFPNLVLGLSRALRSRTAFVGRLRDDLKSFDSIAVGQDGILSSNFSIPITGTLLDELLRTSLVCVKKDLKNHADCPVTIEGYVPESCVGRLLVNSKNVPIGILAVVNDKELDSKQEGFIEKILEIFAARATAELERKQYDDLVSQQSRAVVNSERMAALGLMAGSIAHEINNPLAILSGKASQLKSAVREGKIDPAKFVADCEKIESTVMRIAEIVRGLRSFSRDSGNDPFTKADLKDIIRDVQILVTGKFNSSGVLFSIGDLPSPCLLRCRPVQVAQVIVNLLSNAIDAIEPLPEKWVRLEAKIGEDKRVHITVTDSGKGIPDAVLEKIMMPFFTTKSADKGTGLGLSISQQIIESHGGVLNVNRLSPNTQFVIDLPMAPVYSERKVA